ncbi:type II secretion system F family protein [Providencia manganoxydans]|uniref:type II secretion system F family protein n=1 Tax=Providencia manganoxydans TaxID=2923283 RepID=UPI0032DAF7EA
MFIYSYIALSKNNTIIKDVIISKSKNCAFIELLNLEQTPIKITFKSVFFLDRKNIDYRIHFFHQLSALSSSGINILQSLYILQNNNHPPFWKMIIKLAIDDLKKGGSLANNFKRTPTIFTPTIVSLVEVAEKIGQYEKNFKIIAEMLKHHQQTKKKILQSLRYPIILILLSAVLILLMLIYVLPQFETIYQSFGHDLPFMTSLLIYVSKWLSEYVIYPLLAISLLSFSLFRYKQKFIICTIKILNYIPAFRNLTREYNLTLYFSMLSSTLQAGLPLTECLKCAANTIVHPFYKQACLVIQHSVVKGDSLSTAMKEQSFFPSMACQLIAVAEESGQLIHFVQYLFAHFSEDFIFRTETLLKRIEPILLISMAFLVGGIMVAMYLPIFNLGNVITGI